jgi:hypothetical protein
MKRRGRPKGSPGKHSPDGKGWRSSFVARIALSLSSAHDPLDRCIRAAINVVQRDAPDTRHWEHLNVLQIRRAVERMRTAPRGSGVQPGPGRLLIALQELARLRKEDADLRSKRGIVKK